METSNPATAPSQDERILAALSHLGIIFQYFGALVPLMIWLAQKDKSRYVAFQALQALIVQLLLFVGLLIGLIGYLGSVFLTVFGSAFLQTYRRDLTPGLAEGLALFLPFSLFMALMCVYGLFVLYGIAGAILCLFGKDFRYLVVGHLLARRWRPELEAARPSGF